MELFQESAKVGEVTIDIATGKLAKQANSVTLSIGDTKLLVTVAVSREPKPVDFLPLTVEYRDSAAAAGRIPGNYFRREGRPTGADILTCRLTDRPIRPLFPKGYRNDVQVIATVLSNDKSNKPDILALTGASAALMVSDCPWEGPIAGVRVGRVNGELIAFPTFEQLQVSDMNVVVACSRDAIVMVEAGAEQVSESEMLDALWFAKEVSVPLLDAQIRLRERAGKDKKEFAAPVADPEIKAACEAAAADAIKQALLIRGKHERHAKLSEIKREFAASLAERFPEREDEVMSGLNKVEVRLVREQTLDGVRIDGRKLTEIRPLYIETHPLERPHGSALFQRGETQAMATTTLGTERDALRVDTVRGDVQQTFMLHYNFPPFSVGETRPMRGLSRREVGHGALAQRALSTIIPDQKEFPYTIRVVSDTYESNGSSSMAAVCGGCLSMMDAGVPIKAPVAGIAMGLIQEGERVAVLSDILGDEDHLGDMDFKCCGTEKGITALQMDIKIKGLTREIMTTALEQAKEGRAHILNKMLEVIDRPREDLSPYAPRIESFYVKVDKIRTIIGPGGKVIRGIQEQTGVVVNIDDTGRVSLASSDPVAIEQARRMIEGLTFEAEVGGYYSGVVKRIVDFGAFVEIMPGTDGLLHISEIDTERVENVTDILAEGDDVVVEVLSIDDAGRIRLSRKSAFGVDPDDVMNLRA